LFLFDLGYFKVKALARMATAGAYFCCRLNHQTNIYETVAGRLRPVKLAEFLTAVEGDLLLLEKAISIGTTARVAARLIAVRMPRRSSMHAEESPGKTRRKKATRLRKPT